MNRPDPLKVALENKRAIDIEFKNKAYLKLYSEILEEYLKKDIKE